MRTSFAPGLWEQACPCYLEFDEETAMTFDCAISPDSALMKEDWGPRYRSASG